MRLSFPDPLLYSYEVGMLKVPAYSSLSKLTLNFDPKLAYVVFDKKDGSV